MSRVQIITLHVPVNYNLGWKEAVMRAAPETDRASTILRLDGRYPTDKRGIVAEECRIIGFGRRMEFDDVWRDRVAKRLRPAHPRVCFAIGEMYRRLPRKFRRTCMDIATLAICHYWIPRIPTLTWWSDGRRTADVGRPDWPWDESVFFVFDLA